VIALLALAAPAGAGSGVTYYQYLIPKYTPGTFSIYSCLGGATFQGDGAGISGSFHAPTRCGA
jgi:hypothetical protein